MNITAHSKPLRKTVKTIFELQDIQVRATAVMERSKYLEYSFSKVT